MSRVFREDVATGMRRRGNARNNKNSWRLVISSLHNVILISEEDDEENSRRGLHTICSAYIVTKR